MLEDEARDKDSIAKLPDKFKLATQWNVFTETLETYLGQLLGSGRVPLSYVNRRVTVAEPDEAYHTEQA
jgi:hypothetical protein